MMTAILVLLLVLLISQAATSVFVWRLGVSLGRRAEQSAEAQHAVQQAMAAQAEAAAQRASSLAAKLRASHLLLKQHLETQTSTSSAGVEFSPSPDTARVAVAPPAAPDVREPEAPRDVRLSPGRAFMRERLRRHLEREIAK